MKKHAEAMVLASFTADSLALGAHWIYDTAVIDNDVGRVDTLRNPPENSFHPTKRAGELTHYGDQALILLESIAEHKGLDIGYFAEKWYSAMGTYTGYRDHATKDTLKNFASGKSDPPFGSGSTELGGAVRIAPLIYALRQDRDRLLTAVREQTAMTHNDPQVVESAAYLADVLLFILGGLTPSDAFEKAADDHKELQKWVDKGLQSKGQATRATIKAFGQMCNVSAALPSVIHLATTHGNDLKSALVENVMAGGDSAARGMAVGMVLGAHLGLQSIPDQWLQELKAYRRIVDLLGTLP
jgi:ADP-ribosylglycohydrolase